MLRRWTPSIVLLVCGAIVSGIDFSNGQFVTAIIFAVVFLLVAVAVSPRAFPRSVTHAEAVAAGGPTVYWRPGCPYCIRLRASLGRDAAKLRWVDIWADPAGAAAVREVADGNETVPTVITADRSYVNPDPAVVRALARA